MKMQIEIGVVGNEIVIRGPYSEDNNTIWRQLGGKFFGQDKSWHLPDNDTARAKVAELFGERSDLVEVVISADKCDRKYGSSVEIGGYVLASRRGRDYRVEMPHGVSLESGSFTASGGSVKNPRVGLTYGMTFRLVCRKAFADARGLAMVAAIPELERLAV